MAIGSGLAALVGIASETTVGTAVSPARYHAFESETLSAKKKILQTETLRAGNLYDRQAERFVTMRQAGGDITMPVPTMGFGLMLQHMLGSFAATATIISAGPMYKQVHVPGSCAGKALSIQTGIPRIDGTVEPFTYNGSKVTDWELSMAQSDVLKAKITFDSWDELTLGTTPASPALGTPTYPLATYFSFLGGAILGGGTVSTTSGVTTVTGGTQIAAIRSAKVSGKNALKTDRLFLGNGVTKSEQVENGRRQITGSLEAEFQTRALYDQYRGDVPTAIQLNFGATVGANTFQFNILLPSCNYEDGASPDVSGPDIVIQTVPFTALYEDADPPIQITYISTDTTV
jgi:hypothetical protein